MRPSRGNPVWTPGHGRRTECLQNGTYQHVSDYWHPHGRTGPEYYPCRSGTEKVTKDYDAAGNIVQKMNEAGSMSGVDAVNMLRTYIDQAYGGYYGTTRSDLFCGQNAALVSGKLSLTVQELLHPVNSHQRHTLNVVDTRTSWVWYLKISTRATVRPRNGSTGKSSWTRWIW